MSQLPPYLPDLDGSDVVDEADGYGRHGAIGPDPRIAELEGELAELKARLNREREQERF